MGTGVGPARIGEQSVGVERSVAAVNGNCAEYVVFHAAGSHAARHDDLPRGACLGIGTHWYHAVAINGGVSGNQFW